MELHWGNGAPFVCKSPFCTLLFKYCCCYCSFLIPLLLVFSKLLSQSRVSAVVPLSSEGNRGRGASYLEFKLKSLREKSALCKENIKMRSTQIRPWENCSKAKLGSLLSLHHSSSISQLPWQWAEASGLVKGRFVGHHRDSHTDAGSSCFPLHSNLCLSSSGGWASTGSP